MTAKKTAAEKLAAPPEPQPESDAPPEQPLDAVVIVKIRQPNGDISTDVVTNGDVTPVEVQTLIELGLQSWRQKIGLT